MSPNNGQQQVTSLAWLVAFCLFTGSVLGNLTPGHYHIEIELEKVETVKWKKTTLFYKVKYH